MSNVKIYTAVSEDLSPLIQGEGFCTDVVRYSDYAALEAKCAALAAENAGLNEKMNKLATWPGIEFYSSAWEFNGGDGDTALEFMCDVQTPSADAFLAEVRAQGVDAAIEHLHKLFGSTDNIGEPIRSLEWLAQAFRKGASQ